MVVHGGLHYLYGPRGLRPAAWELTAPIIVPPLDYSKRQSCLEEACRSGCTGAVRAFNHMFRGSYTGDHVGNLIALPLPFRYAGCNGRAEVRVGHLPSSAVQSAVYTAGHCLSTRLPKSIHSSRLLW